MARPESPLSPSAERRATGSDHVANICVANGSVGGKTPLPARKNGSTLLRHHFRVQSGRPRARNPGVRAQDLRTTFTQMTVRTVFETCRPRADVLAGAVSDAEFAADLASVVGGGGPEEYRDPMRFFRNTHPTRGLKTLLGNVCRRLPGAGGETAAIFRLDTSYGGGKTHGLIALAHAARGMTGVSHVEEFLDPALLPGGPVRLAVFDGENADPRTRPPSPRDARTAARDHRPGLLRATRGERRTLVPGQPAVPPARVCRRGSNRFRRGANPASAAEERLGMKGARLAGMPERFSELTRHVVGSRRTSGTNAL